MNQNTIDVIVEILTEFERHDNNWFKTSIKQRIQRNYDDPKERAFANFWYSREAAMRPYNLRSFLEERKDLIQKLERSFQIDEKQLESKVKKTLDEELKRLEKSIPITIKI